MSNGADTSRIVSKPSHAIAVITAALNSARTIPDCINAVHSQTTRCHQIFVEGGSRDDTAKVIRGLMRSDDTLLSGPDKGIYDAMNKGWQAADADIIGTLNSDDYYSCPEVLSWVQAAFEDPDVDACYGDLVYVHPHDTSRVIRKWVGGEYSRERFYFGWMPPHPTFFVRRRVYERFGGFNLTLGTAADYEFTLRTLFCGRLRAIYIPKVMVIMRNGGASNATIRARLRTMRSASLAWRLNGQRPRSYTLLLRPLSKLAQYL